MSQVDAHTLPQALECMRPDMAGVRMVVLLSLGLVVGPGIIMYSHRLYQRPDSTLPDYGSAPLIIFHHDTRRNMRLWLIRAILMFGLALIACTPVELIWTWVELYSALDEAWARSQTTSDPMAPQILDMVRHSYSLCRRTVVPITLIACIPLVLIWRFNQRKFTDFPSMWLLTLIAFSAAVVPSSFTYKAIHDCQYPATGRDGQNLWQLSTSELKPSLVFTTIVVLVGILAWLDSAGRALIVCPIWLV